MLFSWFLIYKSWNHRLCVWLLLKWFIETVTTFLCDDRYLKVYNSCRILDSSNKAIELISIYLLCCDSNTGDEVPIEPNVFVRFNCENSWKYEYLYHIHDYERPFDFSNKCTKVNSLEDVGGKSCFEIRYRLSSTAWIIRSWTKVGFVSSLRTHYAFSNTLQHYCLNATRRWP